MPRRPSRRPRCTAWTTSALSSRGLWPWPDASSSRRSRNGSPSGPCSACSSEVAAPTSLPSRPSSRWNPPAVCARTVEKTRSLAGHQVGRGTNLLGLLGTLLTFVQYLFVAVSGYISQFDRSRAPFFIKPNKEPLRRWMINIILFFSINVLNNHAFSYDISVPVQIIHRTGGSITTMITGYMYGKRYSRIQVVAVLLLTLGVVTAAWSDAQAKTSTSTAESTSHGSAASFNTGLAILFIAQTLSAIMGLYTEETYKIYGPQWQENLFYSHLLSLPLFLPFLPSLVRQFMRLAGSPPLSIPLARFFCPEVVPANVQKSLDQIRIPSQLVYLVLNVLTQYACIRGVNLLAAASSALTVPIVLNIRKLVSLLFSSWLFGNRLATGTLIGAVVVFSAGGLYSLDGRKKPTATRPRAPIVKAS